jgi:hypothetical protein
MTTEYCGTPLSIRAPNLYYIKVFYFFNRYVTASQVKENDKDDDQDQLENELPAQAKTLFDVLQTGSNHAGIDLNLNFEF